MLDTSPKVLHFCYSGHLQPGIIKQLLAEYNAAKSLGLDWQIAYFTHEKSKLPFVHSTGLSSHTGGIIGKAFRYLVLRVFAATWLFKYRKKFDLVLLRYVVGDMFVGIYALIAKKYFTVHHTKELEEATHLGKYLGNYSLIVENTVGQATIRNAAGLIAVTQEILTYESERIGSNHLQGRQPRYVYSNGIDFSRCLLAEDSRGGIPKMLFVAAVFQPWHGLDLLLEKVASSMKEFELHLVGNTDSLIVDDSRVILHGTLSDKEILLLVEKIDIGIGSLGMFRNDLKEAATLKVREYFASGLPVYATHRDSGLPKKFPYFYFYDTLDINNIIEAALHSREHSREDIRSEAEQYLSKVERLKLLNSQLICYLNKK